MGAVDFRAVLRALEERTDVSEDVKRVMRDTLRKVARENGDASLEAGERVEFARHLLSLREERPVIRDRLMARFGINRRTAQRDISTALQLRQKHPIFVAVVADDDLNEEVTEQEH